VDPLGECRKISGGTFQEQRILQQYAITLLSIVKQNYTSRAATQLTQTSLFEATRKANLPNPTAHPQTTDLEEWMDL
jgi:hypothetical protein